MQDEKKTGADEASAVQTGEQAQKAAETAYLQTAIDFLRVISGSGKPELLYKLMYNCLLAENSFKEASGGSVLSSYDIAAWLRLDRSEIELQQIESDEEFKSRVDNPEHAVAEAARDVRRFGLRVTAAEMALSLSRTPGAAGVLKKAEREFDGAIERYAEVMESAGGTKRARR